MRALRAFCLFFLILTLVRPGTAFSAPPTLADPGENCDPSPYVMEEGKMPDSGKPDANGRKDVRLDTQPTSNTLSGPKTVPKPYGCRRGFLYQGKLKPVDSFNRQDGEKLRPYLSEVPAALEDLNTYQHNRRKVQLGAYLGTAGLLILIGGIIASNQYQGITQQHIRAVSVLSGLSIGIGSAIYSLAILRTNEMYLQRATDKYNRAKPDDPIVLQFSTGILF